MPNETTDIALVVAGPIERAPSRTGTSTVARNARAITGRDVPWRTSRDYGALEE